MRRSIILMSAFTGLASCGQQAPAPENNVTAEAAAPAKKHPTYCFFKDADTKGWTATRTADGSGAVKGQVHNADRRYMAAMVDAEVSGASGTVWLTMPPNTTGSGAPGDWWDITGSVPNAAAVEKVTILCGKKTVAELTLKKG